MKMVRRLGVLCCILLLSFSLAAQTYTISGRIADYKDTSSLIGVSIILKNGTDTNITTGLGAVTDENGHFEIGGVSPGAYLIHAEYLGYTSINRIVNVVDKNISAGAIAMKASNNELKGVTVAGKQIRAEQTGDTTTFRADAFKVNPDATTEDLITKMPGVTSDNTGVKVHGESVAQVYVDGKPFFGTDPTLSVRNLPAEIVDQVQVYDQLSDQALFTGFDDGNSQKTMNIVTRKDKRRGEFGKIFGGYGTDGKYNAGGAFNSFEGNRRISIIESSNNINAQNFSSQDVLGVSGGSSGNNFLTGQQPGITTTHSTGINYSDQWGPKIKITASYFFNYTDNETTTDKVRNYTFPTENTAQDSFRLQTLYKESDISQAKNFNNRLNIRFEYTIDSSNSLVITPALSLQQNYSVSGQIDSSFNLNNLLLSNANNNSVVNNGGYTFSNNIVFRHKLYKKGRTISINLGTSLNAKAGDGTYNTISASVDSDLIYPANPVRLNQIYNSYNNGTTVSSNVAYTEPLGKTSQLLFNYNPSVTYSKANTETDTFNNSSGDTQFDPTLSNKYLSTYFTQKGGLSYRLASKDKKLNLMIGANLQYAVLDGNQTFPSALNITRYFTDVLPIALINYKFKDGKNLRILYRTNISPPAITQLQNVVNVNNPLQLSTGNANLRQDYEQTVTLRYGLTRKKTAHNFFIYGYANYINNYIGNATYSTLRTDSALGNGIFLRQGAQLSAPVNLNYYSNNKVYMTYGVPFEIIKSNLNFTWGLNYTHTPGEVNYVEDHSNDWVPSAGIVISSNVSANLDFTLSYTGNYNFVKNSLQVMTNNNYYNHTASFKINWIFLKRVVLNSNISNSYYSTLNTSSGNINYYLWTSYIGYKFLKNRSLEARFTLFDILNQNKSVSRIVAANYVENDITNILRQYGMFQLTYTLRNFKGAPPSDDNSDGGRRHDWDGGHGGGGDYHGGGGDYHGGGGDYHGGGGPNNWLP